MSDEVSLKNIRVTKLTKATYGRWKIEIHDILENHRIWKIAVKRTKKPVEVKTQDGIVTNIKEIDD